MAQFQDEPYEVCRRPFLLASFPRQGTDWLMDCLHFGPAYYREFFNPLCTPPRCNEAIASLFGSEAREGIDATAHYWRNIARPLSADEWVALRVSTWDASRFTATKEVFSPTKLDAMAAAFPDVRVLYRHRKHTFPTSRPDYLANYYQSFELWPTGCGVLDEWKRLYPSSQMGEVEAQCAAHIASAYATLRHAARHQQPALVYEDLVRLSPGALEGYLHCRLPRGPCAERVARRVAATRKPVSFLCEREAAYAKLNVEALCSAMVKSLINMDGSVDLQPLL